MKKSIITICFLLMNLIVIACASAQKENTRLLHEYIEVLIEHSQNKTSSSPYDHIIDNEAYENIIALGPDIIPLIEDYLQNSTSNGLTEYLLKIAIEELIESSTSDSTE